MPCAPGDDASGGWGGQQETEGLWPLGREEAHSSGGRVRGSLSGHLDRGLSSECVPHSTRPLPRGPAVREALPEKAGCLRRKREHRLGV